MNFTVLLFELRDFQWADVEHAFTELPRLHLLIPDVHVLSRHWGWRKYWFGVFSLCMWSCETFNCEWKNLAVCVHVCVKQQRWVRYFQDTRIKNSPDRSCSHSVVATSATTFQKKESLKKKNLRGVENGVPLSQLKRWEGEFQLLIILSLRRKLSSLSCQ